MGGAFQKWRQTQDGYALTKSCDYSEQKELMAVSIADAACNILFHKKCNIMWQ